MKGKVKFYNVNKGYGFIAADDGQDYFVHYTGLSEGLKELQENDSVEFEITDGDRGPKATNVVIASGDDAGAEDAPADSNEEAPESEE